jgi:uncharacterized hydrophobic protein (TIGR00341 family)
MLRLIEVIIPKIRKEDLEKVFDFEGVVDYYQTESSKDEIVYKFLVKAEFSEKFIDKLSNIFQNEENFRIIVSDIITTIPHIEEEKEEKPKKIGIIRVSRDELYENVKSSTDLNYVYISMVVLSTIIAALGLIKNNPAVIIGSMVIAPLLGPNIAMSLATTLGDLELGKKAFITGIVGVFIAFILGIFMGVILDVNPDIEEIKSRIYVNIFDVIIAIASGIAGVLAFSSGTAISLVGVMVALSLLPPLVASGLLLGSGYFLYSLGSFLLFLSNFASLNLAGVLTFTLQGVRPKNWWEEKKAKEYRKKSIIMWIVFLLLLIIAIYIENKFLSSKI